MDRSETQETLRNALKKFDHKQNGFVKLTDLFKILKSNIDLDKKRIQQVIDDQSLNDESQVNYEGKFFSIKNYLKESIELNIINKEIDIFLLKFIYYWCNFNLYFRYNLHSHKLLRI